MSGLHIGKTFNKENVTLHHSQGRYSTRPFILIRSHGGSRLATIPITERMYKAMYAEEMRRLAAEALLVWNTAPRAPAFELMNNSEVETR